MPFGTVIYMGEFEIQSNHDRTRYNETRVLSLQQLLYLCLAYRFVSSGGLLVSERDPLRLVWMHTLERSNWKPWTSH